MTYTHKCVLIAMVFLAPVFSVYAQQSYTYTEGSMESREVRMQRIREYRQESNELQQKVNALGNVAVVNIPMPVLFGVTLKNISPNFGDPRSNGRTHEGEDIMAVKGTPIVSPTQAVVLRTGVGPSEGLYVYTANPGGETFVYMHLDRVGEGVVSGAVLEVGSLIGYVGNTGNASGGSAHLHFEIHTNGNPVDPFPRLNQEFTNLQKITFLNKILTQTTDPTTLAQFLALNFKSTFLSAQTEGIVLPVLISNYIVPTTTNQNILNPGDLTVGSTGVEVRNLQTFLITKNLGPAAVKLAQTGATGTFGPLTKVALVEYQKAMGISPASGYYGPITRSMVLAGVSPTVPTTPPTNSGISGITRTLKLGMTGADVKLLQTVLGISADGSFGPKTKSAVIAFQKSKGLVADGIFGPVSRKVLAGQ